MKRKWYYLLVLCVGLMLITTGCGGSGKSAYTEINQMAVGDMEA